MRISIIGTGYVGLCTGVVFAHYGHEVTCVEIDSKKIDMIMQGISPIYEEHLDELLKTVLASKRFCVTGNLSDAVMSSDISILAVGTPTKNDGSIDLSFIETASAQIGDALKKKNSYHVIVVKSTVLPGTTDAVVKKILEERSGRKAGNGFGLCMVPEFLREGKAIDDALHPYRIIIGSSDERSRKAVEELYAHSKAPVVHTNPKTAEMIKYASNAFLATKVSFINEVGNVCKTLGIDTYAVADGMGFDDRIGRKFLDAGCGFGGSCFGKDIKALLSLAAQKHVPMRLLTATLAVNDVQPLVMIDLLKQRMPVLAHKKIAVLGVSFKAGTDDIRDAPSIPIIQSLINHDAHVVAHDPKAIEHMKKLYPQITYVHTYADALKDADACLIISDWEEYKNLTDADFSSMNTKIIIEGRKTLNARLVTGFEGVCWL